MKVVALILGVLGGLTALGFWSLQIMSCSCALPPQYAKPIYPIDPSSLLGRPFGDVIVLGTPLLAVIGLIAAVLAVLPRFSARRLPRVEIICGLVLALFLGIISIGSFKPHDMTQFVQSQIAAIPGVLVFVAGLLAAKTSTVQPAKDDHVLDTMYTL